MVVNDIFNNISVISWQSVLPSTPRHSLVFEKTTLCGYLIFQSFRSTRLLRQSFRSTWLLRQSFRSTWLLHQSFRSTCLLRQCFRSTRFLRQSYRITWLLLQSFRSTWLLRQLLCGLCCSIFSFLCSNIPVSRAYIVYFSQHVCYYWSCVQFYCRHHDLVDEYPYHKWEEFEDTKGVSRIRKSKKNIQHNVHMQVLLEYCCIYKWKVHIGKIEINIFFSKDPFWTMLR